MTNFRSLGAAACTALFLLSAGPAGAEDTELFYGVSSADPDAQANILFVLDTSGSMDNAVDGDPHGRDRLRVVQDVTKNLLRKISGVNVGIMQFSANNDAYNSQDTDAEGGFVLHAVANVDSERNTMIRSIDELNHFGYTPLSETLYEAVLYFLGEDVDYGLDSGQSYRRCTNYKKGVCSSWEEGVRDKPSDSEARDGTRYISPIKNECQQNFLVYLTDGAPTQDKNGTTRIEALLKDSRFTGHSARECINDHGDTDGQCLDELAQFLQDNDLSDLPGTQNVKVYTIGFAIDLPLLEDTAREGGGAYYLSNNAETLEATLTDIFQNIMEIDSSFTAPSVSVNSFNDTSHLDQLYFTVFKPATTPHWDGNLKRYRLGDADSDELLVLDQNGLVAVDENTGFFTENAQSYWSDGIDGFNIAAGGAAGELDTSRYVVTQSGSGMLEITSENVSAFPPELFGVTEMSEANRSKLLDWARGIDVADDNSDGSTTDARQVLGDPMHSEPAIVIYGPGPDNDQSDPDVVVFFGTNDGYLHAVDGRTGDELFAFMPQELLPNLVPLYENDNGVDNKIYGVDGPITVWADDGGDDKIDSGDRVYLYFGLRRGGNHYYALDVTDRYNPRFLWSISDSSPGYSQLGQTWSPMTLTKVHLASGEKQVVVFGGGYDTRQDDYAGFAADTIGNAVYMADAETGALVWSGSNANATTVFAEMSNAIAASVRALDLDLDGYTDRMYVGDLGGRVWRFDVHNALAQSSSFSVTGGAIAHLGGSAEGANSDDNRRFYYAPDVALGSAEGHSFLNITIGSGYRAHPLDTDVDDYFFVVRDYAPFTALGTEEDWAGDYKFGVTYDSLPLLKNEDSVIPALAGGFKFRLSAFPGEKSLSESRIFQNQAYFTTFAPLDDSSVGSCGANIGAGRLYTIDLAYGVVEETVLDKPGIPPEPIFVFDEPETGGDDEPDTCFGPHCPDPDPEDEECEGDDCDDPPGRDVRCLAGPEACDADADELPVRTFWMEINTDGQ